MNRKHLAIMVLVLLMAVFVACQEEEPTPTLVPTAQEPQEAPTETAVATIPPTNTPSPTEETEDTVWQQVEESGILRVGTSADYPPFEYYDEDFEIVGLDIALVNEVAECLGVEAQVHDFAFEGLGDALQLGQIDLVAAGLTVTPERAGVVSFSNIYFISSEGVLAQENSEIVLEEVEDLAPYRVGVQSGTVYEQWFEDNLLEPGLMQPEKLHLYVDTLSMLNDLEEGFIDLVVVDRLPAEQAAEERPFEVLISGQQEQFFALAVPKGASELLGRVNGCILEMRQDGRLIELIVEYLGLDPEDLPEIPPEVELPPPLPPEEGVCIDGMAFVQDLNLDDNNFTTIADMPAGQPFQKGWRLFNNGTCDWTPEYRLAYVSGNTPAARMGGLPTAVQGTVATGQEYDMYVNLVAPAYPGTYVGYWQMINAQNQPFGQRIWVAINVPGAPTPTPPPTQTPSPSIQFSANPQEIQQGQCSTLSWSTANVQAVFLYPQGQDWRNNGVAGEGTRSVCPATTTTYELRVVKTDGNVEIRTTTVFVTPVVGAPVITRWTAEPSSIGEGQCVTLQWIVSGNVSRITITRDGTILRDGAPLSGSATDCPPGTGDRSYLLEAVGPGGTSRQNAVVRVNPAATPVPTSTPVPTTTPAPQPPKVNSFSVQPNQIAEGNCLNVAWSVGGGATSARILRNSDVILDNAPFNGNLGDCPTPAGSYTYQVEARNNSGDTDSASQTVTVSQVVPDNPLTGTNWRLTAIGQGVLAPDTAPITLSFTSDSQLNGSGGCNSYSAGYTVNGSNLTVSLLITTGIACDEATMQTEQAYFSAFQGATSFEIVGTTLNIQSTTGERLQYTAG